jgi:hypothetical protein
MTRAVRAVGRSSERTSEVGMTIELDHAIVPSRDCKAAAEMVARIFDLP